MYFAQRALMYFPDTARTAPADAGFPQAEEVMLRSADGTEVLAWHVPPKEGKPVVLYFHGNGGSLRHRVPRFLPLVADGTGLVALSYRGFGGSHGSPSETGLIDDARAAYDFARARHPGCEDRAVGRIARHRRCGRDRRGERRRRRHSGSALYLDRRYRLLGLSLHSGAAADEGPVPFRRAHRQAQGAAARAAWRAGPHHSGVLWRAAVRARQ